MRTRYLSRLAGGFMLLLLAVGLAGCGGSDSSSSDYSYAYLQFYNASPNGATVYMREVDGDSFGSAQFGDATALVSSDDGDIDLEFVRIDADDQEVVLDTMTVNLSTGYKTLIVLSGDFSNPEFTEYKLERETLDEHFRLFFNNLRVDGISYDVYMAEDGDPFEAANFLGTVGYLEQVEMTYWDPDEDSDDFDTDEYTLYLTLPGQNEVVFESQTLDFSYETEYLMMIRDVSGAIVDGLSVDAVLNSTYVTNITDVDASSQYRIYNSTNLADDITVTFGGNTSEEDKTFTLSASELSDFTSIDYGDYRISVSSPQAGISGLTNKLITLNQGQSKAIMIYNNNGTLGAATFEESGLPQSYDKTVNFINLISDFDNIDFYLVRSDETIDTAPYYTLNLEFGENETLMLPEDYYEVIAVYEDDNDEQVLLDRTALTGFTEDANYMVTVEPADTATGYEIVILK
ncbi:DUF4397 domain-containing protein [Salinimonas lutimaris]|uniref:DUF4397 domain-containing protein n=1 Tax=Salinimonas lutimaris TaxID=914153 RepID=UPI0010C0AF52|nr:DUF4397 domain-containing protein [Salinimonas lutimaris]